MPDETRVRPNIDFNLNPALNFNLLLISIITILMMAGQASAIDVAKQWYPENQTIKIYNSLNEITWATIRLVSVNPDIDRITKEYNVTAYVNYIISDIDSFKYAFRIEKGKNSIIRQEWYIIQSIPYIVNDYGINSTWRSKEVYNNQTGLNETIWYWDNQTVVIGNHTEYRNEYKRFNPTNSISLVKGNSYQFKQVLFKRAELGDVRINTNVTFFGLTENNMTWWNTSWSKKASILINNTGNDTGLTDYQVNLNVSYDSDMNADFSDIRVVNDTSGLTVPFWNESTVNNSYTNIWFNASNIPASVWTNSTYYLYYNSSSAASASNGTNTFLFFDDFDDGVIGSIWTSSGTPTESGGVLNINGGNEEIESVSSWNAPLIMDFRRRENVYANHGGVGLDDGTIDEAATADVILFSLADPDMRFYADLVSTSLGNLGTAFKRYSIHWISSTSAKLYYDSSSVSLSPVAVGSNRKIHVADSSNVGNPDYDVDWLFVRKYASPEPSAELGTEESVAKARVQVIIIS